MKTKNERFREREIIIETKLPKREWEANLRIHKNYVTI